MSYDARLMEQSVELFLKALGEDPTRPGIVDTPARVARMYSKLLDGYKQDPQDHITMFALEEHEESAVFKSMVTVKDVNFYSFCEHHLMLFTGKAAMAYIPGGTLVGLSKMVRMLRAYCKRLQVQERLTHQVAEALYNIPGCKGSLVLLEAEHYCMSIRGVRSPGAKTLTLATTGEFQRDTSLKEEFFRYAGLGG